MNIMQFIPIMLSFAIFYGGDVLYAENQKDPGFSYTEDENEVAVKEFGIKKEDPIERGFFFWKGEFISPPYVVERRGLAIFINGKCIDSGPPWPLHTWFVKEDPGDPPKESNSFKSIKYTDKYWITKEGYLDGNLSHEKAIQARIELWKKIPDVASAERDKNRPPDGIVVKSATGEAIYFTISDRNQNRIRYEKEKEKIRNSLLDQQEKQRMEIANFLQSGAILDEDRNDIFNDVSLNVIKEIVSNDPANEKLCSIVKLLMRQDVSKYMEFITLASMGEIDKIDTKLKKLRETTDDDKRREAGHISNVTELALRYFPMIQKGSLSESLKQHYQRELSRKKSEESNKNDMKPVTPLPKSNDDLVPVPRPPYGK